MWVFFEICLVVSCKFESLDQHTFELLNFILFASFVTFVYIGTWQPALHTSAPELLALQLNMISASRGVHSLFFHKVVLGFRI